MVSNYKKKNNNNNSINSLVFGRWLQTKRPDFARFTNCVRGTFWLLGEIFLTLNIFIILSRRPFLTNPVNIFAPLLPSPHASFRGSCLKTFASLRNSLRFVTKANDSWALCYKTELRAVIGS